MAATGTGDIARGRGSGRGDDVPGLRLPDFSSCVERTRDDFCDRHIVWIDPFPYEREDQSYWHPEYGPVGGAAGLRLVAFAKLVVAGGCALRLEPGIGSHWGSLERAYNKGDGICPDMVGG